MLIVAATGGHGWGDTLVFLWDAATGKPAWKDVKVPARAFAFNPDGKTLALSLGGANQNPGAVTLYEIGTGRKVCEMSSAVTCSCLVFSPDGQRLAGVSSNGEVYLWDAATGKQLGGPDKPVQVLALSHDGTTLALQEGTAIKILNLTRKEEDQRVGCTVDPPESASFAEAALSPDGHFFAATVHYGIRVWDVTTPNPKLMYSADGMPYLGPAFSDDGTTLVFAYGLTIGTTVVSTKDWKARQVAFPKDIAPGTAVTLAIAPDSKTVAACRQGGLLLYNLDPGKEPKILDKAKTEFQTEKITFTRDGKHLLVSGYVHGRMWGVETGQETPFSFLPTAAGPDGSVFGVPYATGQVMRRSQGTEQTIWQAPGLVCA